jgi:copper chaperone CopZ
MKKLTIGLLVASAAALACSRRPPESRVRNVEARLDGITCPTCVPPLKASLKRTYAKSDVDVDDDKDTATVTFADGENFSAADFRTAVERVKMRVVSVRLQACGSVEEADGAKWLTAGANRFRIHSDRDVPVKTPICANGTLDPQSDPATLQVSSFTENGK